MRTALLFDRDLSLMEIVGIQKSRAFFHRKVTFDAFGFSAVRSVIFDRDFFRVLLNNAAFCCTHSDAFLRVIYEIDMCV